MELTKVLASEDLVADREASQTIVEQDDFSDEMLIQALCQTAVKGEDEVKEFLRQKSRREKSALKNNPKILEAVEKMRKKL